MVGNQCAMSAAFHVQPTPKAKSPEVPPLASADAEVLTKFIPAKYHDFADVFSEQEACLLPPRRPFDHPIDVEPDTKIPFGPIYNMSETEQEALREFLDDMLDKGFIHASSSPARAPVLFIKKKDGRLRLCIDYRGLN